MFYVWYYYADDPNVEYYVGKTNTVKEAWNMIDTTVASNCKFVSNTNWTITTNGYRYVEEFTNNICAVIEV